VTARYSDFGSQFMTAYCPTAVAMVLKP